MANGLIKIIGELRDSNVPDIFFTDYDDMLAVVKAIKDIFDRDEFVTIFEYASILRYSSEFYTRFVGWGSLDGLSIIFEPGGYILKMPKLDGNIVDKKKEHVTV